MYDVIVIGGGPGGYKTAELCSKKGMYVALVEEVALGGTCLNQGCIPFKSYLHTSRIRQEALKLTNSGLIISSGTEINQSRVLAYKDDIVKELDQSVGGTLRNCGVNVIYGHGSITKRSNEKISVSIDDDIIEGRNLVIATGSDERRLTIPSDTEYKVIYSKEMLEIGSLPKEIDIIGAGAIGLEAASYFVDAGCIVNVFETFSKIGGHIDSDISDALKRILAIKGISIYTDTMISKFDKNNIMFDHEGEKIIRYPECVLIAVGRSPKIDRESLDFFDVKYSDRGIDIDESCRTNVRNVYACGDVTGKLMLAHTAYQQAKVIADVISGIDSKINYDVIPRVIYSNPEVLSVGKSGDDCEVEKYSSRSIPMTYSGKYFAENGKDGAKAKMVLDENNCIVGFHMIGNGASEISLAAELMISQKMKVEDIENLVYAHPTYGEIIGDLAGLFS